MAGRQKHMIRSHRSRRRYATTIPEKEYFFLGDEAAARTLADRICGALQKFIDGINNLSEKIRKELEKWQ